MIGTDLHFCYLMRRYIRESDHLFLLAHPGEDALHRVQNQKPALIILEAETPETKNYQILRELKIRSFHCPRPSDPLLVE